MTTRPRGRPLRRDALGLGLRVAHLEHVLEHGADVDYFEIITENFLGDAATPTRNLARVGERFPVVLHGVGLNLLGHEPLDRGYLDRVRRLADAVDAPFVTDHLCWSRSHGASHHDLLPVPHVDELVELAAERAAFVQRVLERPFGFENLSSYVAFSSSTMPEWQFVAQVVEGAGCHLLLDVNNVFVSSLNHGFDPLDYLRAVDFSRVLQVHVAGHTRLDPRVRPSAVDTHDQPVCDEVWSLYAEAWRMGGPFPTLLERDDRLPPLPELVAELRRAREVVV